MFPPPKARKPIVPSGHLGYPPLVVKLVYRPFGLVLGILGGMLAGAAFKRLWKILAHEETTPKAKESEYGWGELHPAATLQGADIGRSPPAVERRGARAFERVTGTWPGD